MTVPGTSGNPLYTITSTSANAGTGTHASVASSASNVTLLAANSSRKGFSIFNDSTQVLYVKLGATATTSSYAFQVAAGGYYENGPVVYSGNVDGIWASANGNARVVELT